MLFSYQKYSEFGINVYDYAGVFEFLVAPFADYLIIIFTLIIFLVVYLLYRLDILWRTKHSSSYNMMTFRWDRIWKELRQVSYSLLVILYLYVAADNYGELKRDKIIQQSEITVKYQDNTLTRGKFIGITGNFMFLLQEGEVKAIPVTALVKEFDIHQTR